MPVTALSQASSLNVGADLWILPPLAQSKAAQRVDWYLNLQLSRSLEHKPTRLHPMISKILERTELPKKHFNENHMDHLMISTSRLLPNRWLVQAGGTENPGQWCESINKLWIGLNHPTLRVFLPTGLSAGAFQNLWKQYQSFDDFTVVVE